MEDDREILLSNEDLELTTATKPQHEEVNGQGDGDAVRPSRSSRDPATIVYVSACVAAVGGILFGYDMGIISGAKIQMQKDLMLTCSQVEAVVAFLPIGGFFASLVGGYSVDNYGRRFTIVANAFLFTIGAVIVSLTSSLSLMLLGRFILGFAVSLSAIAECIYISEIATPEKRGMLVSLNELAITVGILVSFLVNYIFADTEHGWRIMFGLSTVVAIAQGIAMLFLPKTPQYLMIKKQEEKAEQVLRQLELTTNTRQTMTNIRLALAEESSQSFVTIILSNADNIGSRLLIGCGLVLLQQFSGQPNIIYYAADIFKQVGYCSQWSSTLASVGLGIMKVLSTVMSLLLVDRIGRRKALLFGISAMMISVLILAIFGFYKSFIDGNAITSKTCVEISALDLVNATLKGMPNNVTMSESICGSIDIPAGLRYLAFFGLIAFVCAYSFSFGPITWVILSEIFPASSKGRAMALATALNWLGNSFVSGTFNTATATFTLGGVFFFYALVCAFAIAFVALLVPETKNKSLEEISKELRTNWIVQSLPTIPEKWKVATHVAIAILRPSKHKENDAR